MADNNRNRGYNAEDENRNKNLRRSDDSKMNQRNFNPNDMDLDRDGNTGNTGGFYGGTNYMGTSYMGSNFVQSEYSQPQDWNANKHDDWDQTNRNHNSQYGRQDRQNYNRNEQQHYGNISDQPYSNRQQYNRNDEYNQNYNRQYGDNQGNRQQWQEHRQDNSNRNNRRQDEHSFHYGYVAGTGHLEDQHNRQSYRSDNRQSNWNQGSSGRNEYRGNPNDDRSWWDKTRDQVSSWFGDDDAERKRKRDHHTEGQHRGKGPKEYRRSDNRIHEDVCDRLSDDPYVDASDVEVKVEHGEVTLVGMVDNRNTRRRIEDIIDSIQGVLHVQNNLRVGQAMNVGATTIKTSPIESETKDPRTNIDTGRSK